MKRLIVLLIWAAVASAHSGDRVFPFYELTDEMLENIDLHDGLIDEWYEIGEPSMTLLDFKTVQDFIPADPSNVVPWRRLPRPWSAIDSNEAACAGGAKADSRFSTYESTCNRNDGRLSGTGTWYLKKTTSQPYRMAA